MWCWWIFDLLPKSHKWEFTGLASEEEKWEHNFEQICTLEGNNLNIKNLVKPSIFKNIFFYNQTVRVKCDLNGESLTKVKVTQSCLTLCDSMNYTAHGILQARILEWVAFPFSRGSSWPRNWTRVSCITGGFFTNWTIREAPDIYTTFTTYTLCIFITTYTLKLAFDLFIVWAKTIAKLSFSLSF